MFVFLLACTINVTKDSSITILPDSGDSGDGGGDQPNLAWATFTTKAVNDQLYDVESDGSSFYIGNPYNANYTGIVYRMDPGVDVAILDSDAVNWRGSAQRAVLGVNVSILNDGVTTYAASQEYGTNRNGRFLVVPVESETGAMEDYATLDVEGDTEDGYFGTGIAANGGFVYVSATSAPAILKAPASVLAGGSWSDFADLGLPASGDSDGFGYMDIASGSDGMVAVSHGDFLQHFDTSGNPDWWYSPDNSGTGTMPATEWAGRDVNNSCKVVRLTDTYAVTCLDQGNAYMTLYTPEGTQVVEYSGAVGIAEGVVNGHGWTAIAYIGIPGEYEVYDTDGNIVFSGLLPMPNQCAPQLASNGTDTFVAICRYNNYGAKAVLTVP